MAFSPDGQKLASAGYDNTVRIWDLTGKELVSFTGHTSYVESVAFSPDGQKLASASYDNTVRVWDLTGKELAKFTGHTNSVRSVVFSPDGQKLASASSDDTVRVWNTSGKELDVLKGHTGSVNSVVFSPDGQKLASASSDDTVRVWKKNWNNLFSVACDRLRYHNVLLNPEIEDALPAGNACLDHSNWNDNEKAIFQRDRALNTARQGDYKQAASELKEAKRRDSTIDLNPETEEVDHDPDHVAKELVSKPDSK